MKEFRIVPKILEFTSALEFIREFQIGSGDLVITNRSIYGKYLAEHIARASVIFGRDYAAGEPSDEMVERIHQDIRDITYERIFAIGGGTILDVAKLLTLKKYLPVPDLFDGKLPIEKEKTLILVPTTCGTGSEVTNISVLELKSGHTKLGLAADALYGDYAVLVPELLSTLPMEFFAASSIDALIHAMESFTSPRAGSFSRMYSGQAIRLILTGYMAIAGNGEQERFRHMEDFLRASAYAGIAFGNAGCAAVHAMSYPLGAAYHIPHGKANYAFLTEVYKTYQKLKPEGSLLLLNELLAEILDCQPSAVYEKLEALLNIIQPQKALHEYGMTAEDVESFTENVVTKQGRLMRNNYVELNKETIRKIYTDLL